MYSLCIIFCPVSPSLTYSCLSQMRQECHSIIYQSRSTFAHMKRIRYLWKPVHNLECASVCVLGSGEWSCRSGWSYVLRYSLPCSEQCSKPHAHNDMINEINTSQRWSVFLEGMGFHIRVQYIWARTDIFKVHFSSYFWYEHKEFGLISPECWNLEENNIWSVSCLYFNTVFALMINTSYQPSWRAFTRQFWNNSHI